LDIFDLFATSDILEESGKEFKMGSGDKACYFRIARVGNTRYQRNLAQEYEANRETLDMKGSDEAISAAEDCVKGIMLRVTSRAVLLGWRGPVVYKGKPIEYSFENAELLLQHKDFYDWVTNRAKNYSNFLLSAQEEDAKNFATTSSGSSNGEVVSASSGTSV
jgi:hypothetical protein